MPPLAVEATDLGLMKPTTFLINTAHGAIVDEAALGRALRALPNVVLTPHLGSAVVPVREGDGEYRGGQRPRDPRGKHLPNCVNPEIYRPASAST